MIRLYFKVLQPLGGNYRVFLHFDGTGARIQRSVSRSVAVPDQLLDQGTVHHRQHRMGTSRLNQSAGYQVFTGMWPGGDGTRLRSHPGPHEPDDRVRLSAIKGQVMESSVAGRDRASRRNPTAQPQRTVDFGPALRRPALIHDWSHWVSSMRRCRMLVLRAKVLGGCLVERLPGGGLLSALSIEPLAQQRGGGRALLEEVIKAARTAQLAASGSR